MRRFFQSLTFTLFIFGFAGWFYIAENAVFHPQTLAMGLTHFASWPREDTFGIICFAASFVSLFTYMMIRDKTVPISESKVVVAPRASKKSIAKAKESQKVMKLGTIKAKVGSKKLKTSVNKAKTNQNLLKIKTSKISVNKGSKKIKVMDLSRRQNNRFQS